MHTIRVIFKTRQDSVAVRRLLTTKNVSPYLL